MKLLSRKPRIEESRSGFLTNYPPYGFWRREAAEGFMAQRPLNIYVHVPYCIQRCAYCYYKTETLSKQRLAEIERYVDALCEEIRLVSRAQDFSRYKVSTIYFGGGTPTLLTQAQLERIVGTLSQVVSLEDIELTFEAEPVTLTRQKMQVLERLGVNRISLGIQSFSDEIIQATGRKDTEAQALRSIELAKSSSAIVNIDLLSGLAGETDESWAYSLRRAFEIDPHCITIYKMEPYPNTEYFVDARNERVALPDEATELRFMREAIDQLEKAGYQPLTFFTFSKKREWAQQHIRNRWLGEAMYGFGVSAFGQWDGTLIQNTSDLRRYIEILESGQLPLARGYRLTSVDHAIRHLLLGMKLVHLDHRCFQKRHGLDLLRVCAAELQELEDAGVLTVNEQAISLTSRGVLYGDYAGRTLAWRVWQTCRGEG